MRLAAVILILGLTSNASAETFACIGDTRAGFQWRAGRWEAANLPATDDRFLVEGRPSGGDYAYQGQPSVQTTQDQARPPQHLDLAMVGRGTQIAPGPSRGQRRLALGAGRAPDDSTVFARWNGGSPFPSRLSQDFAAAMDALKIDCTLHGLRHTHVSALIAAGLGRADNQPPHRPRLPGDHTQRLQPHVLEYRHARGRDHGGDLFQGPQHGIGTNLLPCRWQSGGNEFRIEA